MDQVPAGQQSICATLTGPNGIDKVLRKAGDVLDVDALDDPRDPDTFAADASFLMWADAYFPGYYGAELVSAPGHVWTRAPAGQGPIKIQEFQDTGELRQAASWAVFDYGSTRRTYASLTFSLLSVNGTSPDKIPPPLKHVTHRSFMCRLHDGAGDYTRSKGTARKTYRQDSLDHHFWGVAKGRYINVLNNNNNHCPNSWTIT